MSNSLGMAMCGAVALLLLSAVAFTGAAVLLALKN